MPNIDEKNQPGADEGKEFEDETVEDEVRRNAERHGGFDDEGRPIKAPEVEPEVTEDEAKLAEEHGERGQSPGQKY
jgi:hypothetical protein